MPSNPSKPSTLPAAPRPPLRNPPRTRLGPKKLLQSKWTAVHPREREKHFVVVRLVDPDHAPVDAPGSVGTADLRVLLQAVYSKRTWTLPWRELTDPAQWRQGWL